MIGISIATYAIWIMCVANYVWNDIEIRKYTYKV